MGGLAPLRDLRSAVKSLGRTPGFTLIAIVTLGLGVGANTSMFSILDGYMLRPAPYAEHDRLDRIFYRVEGRETPQPGREPAAVVNGVSPHYFETVGTRLLAGRTFSERDTAKAPRVFVVNQTMARSFFGDSSPIGRRIALAGGEAVEWGEIVGVVGDVESVFGDHLTVPFQLYHPLIQEPRPALQLAVRTASVAPAAVVDAVRTAIAGLGLAALGIYGVVARTVAQRAGEFGIRLALGARPSDITRLVLGSGVRLALAGAALGLAGAVVLSRALAAFFPAVHTDSPALLAGVTVVLIAIAQLACYRPARAVSRIDPVCTLRAE